MNSLFRSLSARLAFWYAIVFVCFSGIALLIFYLSIDTILREDIDEDLREDVFEMRRYLLEGGIENVKKEVHHEVASGDPSAIFIRLLDRIRELVVGMREMTDNIAHDLRSQLGRIRANAEMSLSETMTLEERRSSAADIIEECDRLLHLINTTLEVSQAEFGLSQLAMQRVNLSEIINDAYELFEPIAEEKDIDLHLSVESDCYLNGHTQYLQRMLANFLDNALKYTLPKGRVGLELASDNKEVLITIRDTGIGVSRKNQPRIFDRFFSMR